MILVVAFCLSLIIGMLAWGIFSWKKEGIKGFCPQGGRKGQRPARKKDKDQAATANGTNKIAAGSGEEGRSQDEESASGDADYRSEMLKDENESADSVSFVGILGYILLIFPAISVIQFILYQVLPLGLNVPEELKGVFDFLSYISTISLGIALVLFLWSAKKKIVNEKFRSPAVLAFILELILFVLLIFNADLFDKDILSPFLNNITNNLIASLVVIPIVLFVVLDIAISLILDLFTRGNNKDPKDWWTNAQGKLDEIRKRIVFFSLNMFIGILNLFEFIPDFFNDIGDLLLSKKELFPVHSKKDSGGPGDNLKKQGQKKEEEKVS